jgi:hypothetical protein
MERNAANIKIRRAVRARCKSAGIAFDVTACDRMIMDGKDANEIFAALSTRS